MFNFLTWQCKLCVSVFLQSVVDKLFELVFEQRHCSKPGRGHLFDWILPTLKDWSRFHLGDIIKPKGNKWRLYRYQLWFYHQNKLQLATLNAEWFDYNWLTWHVCTFRQWTAEGTFWLCWNCREGQWDTIGSRPPSIQTCNGRVKI